MANEIFDGADMIGEFFGEREGLSRQTGKALSQGVVEAFDVVGFAGLLRNGFVPLRRDNPLIDFI